MSLGRSIMKRLLWPGPDFGTRARYRLKSRLLRGRDVRTLDIGCGNGCLTMAAAEGGGYALGISNQPEYLVRAAAFRDRLGIPADRCEFKACEIDDLANLNRGSFDQIILFETLEHLYHDDWVISVCRELLAPDGWLHITVPNRDSHMHFQGVERVQTGGHVRHGYDAPSLEAMLRDNGLEPIDRLGVGGVGTVLGFRVVAAAQRLPGFLGAAAGVGAFFLCWPFVPLFNLVPARPWSLYILAARREKRPAVPGEARPRSS